MKTFLFGMSLPLIALLVAGLLARSVDQWWLEPGWQREAAPSLAGLIAGLPLLGAAIGAQLVLLLSPRRLFDRHATEGAGRRLVGGIAGGIAAAVLIGVLLILADQYVPDSVLVGAAGLVSGALAILPFARVRQGMCFHCGYDISAPAAPGQPGFGRCPECGADCMAIQLGAARVSVTAA